MRVLPVGEAADGSDFPDQRHYTNRPTVYFAVKFLRNFSGGRGPASTYPELSQRSKKIIARVANDSSMFDAHTFQPFGAGIADFTLEIKFLNYGSEGRAVVAALISCYTLGIVPTWHTDNYRMDARLLARERKVLRVYRYEEQLKSWYGIWLLPWIGKTHNKGFDVVIENMTRTLLRDLVRDELLPYSN
jgi:hypothetical protein